jgi:hypothetical protein
MTSRIKYIYYFRGDLRSHVDIYKSWVDIAKDEIDISMLTIIDIQTYKAQNILVTNYREKGIKIKVVPDILKSLYTILYFTYLTLSNKRVVVHLRKQSPKPFDLMKKIFPQKLKYIIEIEGDSQSELEYLSEKVNQYQDGFYDNVIEGMIKSTSKLEQQFDHADGIFTITIELKELLLKRYSKLNLENKMHVIPTGFDSNKFYPDKNLRIKYRKEFNLDEKFVMVFTGNVFYSWQNIKRSLELFQIIKTQSLFKKVIFLLLIRKQDHYIVEKFLKNMRIKKSDYLLTNVVHEEVNGLLNASDMAVLLRENHTLNKVASPGKLGEYLATGINVLTTKHIGDYSEKMDKHKIGILIDDIYSDKEVIDKLKSFEQDKSREEISRWAVDNFSVQSYKSKYVDTLGNL